MIHVGIDTVNMNGEGFEVFVNAGDKFRKSEKLMFFVSKKIKEASHPDTVIDALTNAFDFTDIKKSVE